MKANNNNTIMEIKNIKDLNSDQLEAYNWPSEGDVFWRHICDFEIINSTGRLCSVDAINSARDDESIYLRGNLVPRPSHLFKNLLRVQIEIRQFSIDYGTGLDDSNRGPWLESCDEVWYKMEFPSNDYRFIARDLGFKIQEFFKVHDALMHGRLQPYLELVSSYHVVPKYKCDKTIQELHKLSDEAFSMDFLSNHGDFVIDHLNDSIIDFERSKRLRNSIQKLLKLPDIKIARKDGKKMGTAAGSCVIAGESTVSTSRTLGEVEIAKRKHAEENDDGDCVSYKKKVRGASDLNTPSTTISTENRDASTSLAPTSSLKSHAGRDDEKAKRVTDNASLSTTLATVTIKKRQRVVVEDEQEPSVSKEWEKLLQKDKDMEKRRYKAKYLDKMPGARRPAPLSTAASSQLAPAKVALNREGGSTISPRNATTACHATFSSQTSAPVALAVNASSGIRLSSAGGSVATPSVASNMSSASGSGAANTSSTLVATSTAPLLVDPMIESYAVRLEVGAKVETQRTDPNGQTKWLSGKITTEKANGTFDILHSDGSIDIGVPLDSIRKASVRWRDSVVGKFLTEEFDVMESEIPERPNQLGLSSSTAGAVGAVGAPGTGAGVGVGQVYSRPPPFNIGMRSTAPPPHLRQAQPSSTVSSTFAKGPLDASELLKKIGKKPT